jgi:hypothetical protein
MDNKVIAEINDWVKSQGETIALGTLCWRTFVMVAYLPPDGATQKLREDNDLGIAYAIGYQSAHIKDIQETGQQVIVSAYNNLKDYFRKNPIKPAEETNGSTN